MDERMNTVQRDPLAMRRDGAVRQLENALTELAEIISTSQMIWATGKCMVDKKAATELVGQIHNLLPDAVKQATEITRNEQAIREKANREANEQTTKSREDAQKMIDDAVKEAQEKVAAAQKKADEISRNNANAANAASTMKAQAEKDAASIRQSAENSAQAIFNKAQQDANAIILRAQQEAQMIIADAESRARNAISDEIVYRMAVMAAEELREQAHKDIAEMRQYYVTGCCNMMSAVDDYLMTLVADIRNERQNLMNHQ